MATKKVVKKATPKKATPKKAVKKTKPAKTPGLKKGSKLICNICGMVVAVDNACGCVETCDLICCGKPMKEKNN